MPATGRARSAVSAARISTTYRDAVVSLPRSVRDHMTNQMAFGPDGKLYFSQGAISAMGAPDNAWALRSEHLLIGCDPPARHDQGRQLHARRQDRVRRHLQPVRHRRCAHDLRTGRPQRIRPGVAQQRHLYVAHQRLGCRWQHAGRQLACRAPHQRRRRSTTSSSMSSRAAITATRTRPSATTCSTAATRPAASIRRK